MKHRYHPLIGFQESPEQPQQCRLSSSVVSGDPENFTGPNGKADGAKLELSGLALDDAFGLDEIHGTEMQFTFDAKIKSP